MITNTSAVILAGGKSSRMGRDKSQLVYEGATFCQRLVDIFSTRFSGVYLSVSPFSSLEGPNIVKDQKFGLGPLSGLLAAMETVQTDNIFICATDMPFADPDLAVRLTEMLGEHDACLIRRSNGRVEAAFGVFSVRVLPEVRLELETGKGSIMALINRIDALIVDESQLGNIDERAFLNINTPDDYSDLF